MCAAAPSIFALERAPSRSARYTCIPTIDVLRGLAGEGFAPFLVAQGRTRDPARGEFTRHLVRLRQAGAIGGADANEVILVNSHDGASCY